MTTFEKNRVLIGGATVYTDNGFGRRDVLLDGGRIAAIAEHIEPTETMNVIRADGKYLLPGLVDLHVHLREPGGEQKERIATATRAASRGGFTTLCAMPNITPAPDSVANILVEQQLIDRSAEIEVLPYATITAGRKGWEAVDFEALKPYAVAFSDDGNGIQSEGAMRNAMEQAARANVILALHCEVESLVGGGCIHKGEFAARHNYIGIPSESEWREVERDVKLAAETGCRIHICHVSSSESVDCIRRAKAAGVAVTAETAPHYLVLCDEDLKEEGRYKMNPPIRSRADMEALRRAVADGTIDVIATDHAPHTAEEKSRGLVDSPFGVSGLETALPTIYTFLVGSGIISLERMVELLSVAPRRIFRLGGGLKVGERADLTIVDFASEFNIDSSCFLSMGHSTPFDGMRVRGEVVMTISSGRIAYRRDRFKVS